MRWQHHPRRDRVRGTVRGFTLVELLVVVAIMLILLSLTLATYNSTISNDRIRGAARQMQSALMGAQSRAILARAPRGIRLVPDSADGTVVSTLQYIEPAPDYQTGTIMLGRKDGTPGDPMNAADGTADSAEINTIRFDGGNTTARDRWNELTQQQQLLIGSILTIGSTPYTITGWSGDSPHSEYYFTPDFATTGVPSPAVTAHPTVGYSLQLPPALSPGEEPLLLPSGAVIDLDQSALPSTWNSNTNLDILFSPRGPISGTAASQGMIHLYLAERQDTVQNILSNDTRAGEKLLVTVFTRSGHVGSFPVDITSVANRYNFAKRGKAAGR